MKDTFKLVSDECMHMYNTFILSPKLLQIFSYNAFLEACTAPLPTYNEAIKEPVFAPPDYSAVIAHSSATPVSLPNETSPHHIPTSVLSSAGNERTGENASSSSNRSNQEPQSHIVKTITSVEVHHADVMENEIVQVEDKSSEE